MNECCKETIRLVLRTIARQDGVDNLSDGECDKMWRLLTEQDQMLRAIERVKKTVPPLKGERT